MAQAPPPPPQNANEPSEEVTKLWNEVVERSFCGQFVFWLNVYWPKYSEEKDDLWALFLKFLEQQEKHGSKPNSVAYPQFCKLLQQIEGSNQRVKKMLAKAGDRSTMGKVFGNLGFKLRGDVTLIETLLFLYEETVNDLCTAPQSKGDLRLREAKKSLASVEKESEDLMNQKLQCEKNIEQLQKENQPMKAIKAKQDLASIDDKINKSKVDRQKKLKQVQKELNDAEANLIAEMQAGTDASNWLKGKCEKAGKKFTQQ
jgi:gas vesicle protein